MNTNDAARATAETMPTIKRPGHYAETLSFMRFRKPADTGIDHWCVEPTGRYDVDCETGFRLANEFMRFIAAQPTNGHRRLLNAIVRDIHEGGRAGKDFTGVEAGFFMRINEVAMVVAPFLAPEGGAA